MLSASRPTRSNYPPKRANAIVAVESVVVVQRAGRVDVAHVAGVRRIGRFKMHPKRLHTLALSTFFHRATMFFTSHTSRAQ
jgi:hypothetical protein